MTPKVKAVDNYIREKHTQEECVGFIDGYEKCQEDMADKKYTEEDMLKCWEKAMDIAHCTDDFPMGNNNFKYPTFEDFINSLNKQDNEN